MRRPDKVLMYPGVVTGEMWSVQPINAPLTVISWTRHGTFNGRWTTKLPYTTRTIILKLYCTLLALYSLIYIYTQKILYHLVYDSKTTHDIFT